MQSKQHNTSFIYLQMILVASLFGIHPSLLVPCHDEPYSSCTIASRPVERDAKSWRAKKDVLSDNSEILFCPSDF